MKKLNKILCIDFGTKIIGFAITDNERKFALPFCEIPNILVPKSIHNILFNFFTN